MYLYSASYANLTKQSKREMKWNEIEMSNIHLKTSENCLDIVIVWNLVIFVVLINVCKMISRSVKYSWSKDQ